MKSQLLNYTRYNLEANEKFAGFLCSLTDEQLNKEIVSSFPSIKKTVYHIWGAQWIWLKRLHGDSPSAMPNKDFTGDFKEATNQLLRSSEELIEFVKSANVELLESVITYRAMDGTEYKSRIADIIQHVVNHSTFHRGQLITMLRQLGFTKLFSTDYIVWHRE